MRESPSDPGSSEGNCVFGVLSLYRLAIWLVNHLPQWFVFFVAGTIAEINFIFSPRSRRGVYTNQAHALPPETGWLQRWRCARAAFRYFAYSVVDFFRIPLMNPQNLDRFVAGIERLGSILAR